MPIFSWSAFVFGSTACEITGSGNTIRSRMMTLSGSHSLSPVVAMADRARQIGVENLSERLPVANPRDEIGRLTATFNDMLGRLEASFTQQRQFMADASHELRTPLSIFHGNLETLLEGTDLDESETRHIYEVLKRHSDRLNLLVNDLLSLARLESNEANLLLSEINLRDFLAEVTRGWTTRLAAKNLRLELQVPEDFPVLRADERRLEEVVHNLLDNAVNYSHANSRILIQGSAPNQEIVLSVSDQGKGIAPADLPRIFERFYRADRARSRELGGTGLGLSIVKHIAQLHGGRVEAESTLGQGTTICLILPNRAAD